MRDDGPAELGDFLFELRHLLVQSLINRCRGALAAPEGDLDSVLTYGELAVSGSRSPRPRGSRRATFHAIAATCGIEVVAKAAALRSPLLIKPADGSGSKGVTRITRSDDLPDTAVYARDR
ncbi:hypothetical protein ACIRU2_10815 [Streptomyces sp. NPDC101169]|uniref:hypothetical protein n=1 Tax=Streptomyces sp. NPDC101169 TaxID=3366121 RepID=UPI00380B0D69